MEAILAFGAASSRLRLAGLLAARWRRAPRSRSSPLWSAGLAAYALGAAAIAWGAAAGWNDGVFRAYYLFGGLLTAALLGAGSLLGRRRAGGDPDRARLRGARGRGRARRSARGAVAGTSIPEAQEHLALFPARILAIVGNVAGSLALVGVAVAGFRRRPLGNALLLAGFALAAVGSARRRARRRPDRGLRRALQPVSCTPALLRAPDNSYLLQTTRLLA